MKNKLFWGIGGLVLGVVAVLTITVISTPDIMMKEALTKFDSFEEATSVFEETVAEHGWKIPAAHDLQATMNKYNYEVDSVVVYELCHPDHASKILELDEERIVSSMMPCRVSIYEKSDGKVYVSWMNTGLMGKLFGGVISEVMDDASSESRMMINKALL